MEANHFGFKLTRNSPPLPSSNSSTYPSFDSGFIAFQATVTELFTVAHSSWIIVGIDGTENEGEKNLIYGAKLNHRMKFHLYRSLHGILRCNLHMALTRRMLSDF